MSKREIAATEIIEDEDDDDEIEIDYTNSSEIEEEKEVIEEKPKVSSKPKSAIPKKKVPYNTLSEKEREKIDKSITGEEDKNARISAVDMLVKFKNFISSNDFDKQAERVSKKYSITKSAIKNRFINGFLGTIADVLNLTVSITGDVIIGAINFINNIIKSIINFTTATLHKLINLLTLNCGTVVL